uniref:Uncharacterized protein n=1 Tax=Chrysemys picta bellii TaxID=8478 RepID=A0A8C3FRT1_CHRPI
GLSAPALLSAAPRRLSDFQVLIEKVGGKPEVLLVGESQEGKDTRALMAAFVQELFPDACKPGMSPAMAVTQTQPGAKPGASNSQSQLIFFLCRASSLRGKQAEIQKILKEVKKFSRRAPAALVGVIVQPKKEEETEARKLMENMLQGAFPRQPLFIPGRPRGKLAIMKAACRASEALQQRTSADVKQDGTDGLGGEGSQGAHGGSGWRRSLLNNQWGPLMIEIQKECLKTIKSLQRTKWILCFSLHG